MSESTPRYAPQTKLGAYQIVRLLGRGGMGEVYEAEETDTGRRLALKVLAEQLGGPQDRERFLREGRLAASVSHTNVVYVFGADEIDGVPVISMELAQQGTLKDRVTDHGPLMPAEAVDAILQVIDGLDAAERVGVLHRDVKPANCFVGADGTVKIGDFGLSISTMARDTTRLSQTGTFHGTPAFASPEQLWGHPLDVRADIYSVGATLNYLLTGRPPFDDANLMALLKKIESQAPAPIRDIRKDVPRGLSAVVARCLEKERAERFADYRFLAEALRPFASRAVTPRVLGRRLAAGIADTLILTGAVLPVQLITAMFVTFTPPIRAATDLIGLAYFVLAEGLLGTTLGKAALGLRVIGLDGARPGLWRAGVRGLLFFAISESFLLVRTIGEISMVVAGAEMVATWGVFLLFATARRRNGYAAVHDLASGTRVVPAAVATYSVASPDQAEQATLWQDRLGPFLIARPLPPLSPAESRVLTGFDERLKRMVWILVRGPGAPVLPAARQQLGLSGRPRWLGAGRIGAASWDAFEAIAGRPIGELNGPQPWELVRRWILDIATVLARADERSQPPLTLDRIWIARDGRAWLIDWPAFNIANGEPPDGAASLPATPSGLLKAVAEAGTRSAYPLPVKAGRLLRDIERTGNAPESLLAVAREMNEGPAGVARRTRVAQLAFIAALPVILFSSLLVLPLAPLAYRLRPELYELGILVDEMASLERQPQTDSLRGIRDAMRTHLNATFGERVRAMRTGSDPLYRLVLSGRSKYLQAIGTGPAPTPEAAEAARQLVAPWLAKAERLAPKWWEAQLALSTVAFLVPFGMSFMLLAVLSATAWRGGWTFKRTGLAIVRPDGNEVAHVHAGLRALFVWAPVAVAAMALLRGLAHLESKSVRVRWFPPGGSWRTTGTESTALGVALLALAVLAGLIVLSGLVAAIRRPERGWQDRLADTWIVPR